MAVPKRGLLRARALARSFALNLLAACALLGILAPGVAWAVPTANAGSGYSTHPGENVTLDGSGSSGSGPLQYSWLQTAGPATGLFNDSQDATVTSGPAPFPTIHFTSKVPGTYTIQLTVRDGTGQTNSSNASVSIPNRAPTANAGSPQTVTAGTTVALSGSATELDSYQSVSYLWTQTGGNGENVTLANPTTLTPSFTPRIGVTYQFTLTATDNYGSSGTSNVTITGNTPPTANAGATATFSLGTTVVLTGSAADVDGDTLHYSWVRHPTAPGNGPPVTLNNPLLPNPSFLIPASGGAGRYTFLLTASDGRGGVSTSAVTIRGNTPPVAHAGRSRTVPPNTPVRLEGSADDPDVGDAVGYSWVRAGGDGPTVVLDAPGSATPSFTPTSLGLYRFRLTVSDGSASATDSVTLTVDTTITASAGASLVVTLDWSFLSVPAGSRVTTASFANAHTLATAFTPDVAGAYRVILTARNARGHSAFSEVVATVIETTLHQVPSAILTLPAAPTAGSLRATIDTSGTTEAVSVLEYRVTVDRSHLDFTGSTVGPAAAQNFTEDVRLFIPTVLDVKFQAKTGSSIIRSGQLQQLQFSAPSQAGDLPAGAVSVLFVSATGDNQIGAFRPTADAGLRQNAVTAKLGDGTSVWPSPVATPGQNLRPFLQLDGRASRDANLPPRHLAYRWSVLPGGRAPTTFSNASSPTPTFTPSGAGIYRFGLNVSNGALASPTSVVEVVLDVANRNPTALPVATNRTATLRTRPGAAPLAVEVGDTVLLDATASTDPILANRATLSYAWAELAGPGAISLGQTGRTSFVGRTPPRGPGAIEPYVPGFGITSYTLEVGCGYLLRSPGSVLDLR